MRKPCEVAILRSQIKEIFESEVYPVWTPILARHQDAPSPKNDDIWVTFREAKSDERAISREQFRCMLSNVRRPMPKWRSDRTPNWFSVMDVIGCESASAVDWCRWAGIDPDGKE